MRHITRTSKRIFDTLQEQERESCSAEVIEHIILLYIEFKEDFEKNLFDKSDHPELYIHGEESIDIAEYLKYIENELEKDKIDVNEDLLTKIISAVGEYDE